MGDPAQSNLYERDFYAWTQEQAGRLRELRGHNRIDVANLAEEIEDLGASARRSVESHLEGMLVHLLNLARSPASEPHGHWFDEVIRHQSEAERTFTPSMREAIDLERVWRKAVRRAHQSLLHHNEPGIPSTPANPFEQDDLLAEAFDAHAALEIVRAALGQPPS